MFNNYLIKILNKEKNIKTEKLEEILNVAEKIIVNSKDVIYEKHPINALIKALTEKAQQDFLFNLYSQKSNYQESKLLSNSLPLIYVDGNSIEEIESKCKRKINISTDNIISRPWNKNRFIDAITYIGKGCINGEWHEDLLNHFVSYYKPINLYLVTNGTHSITCGVLKREGKIEHNVDVYNLESYYNYIYFDGINYKKLKSCKEEVKIYEDKEIIFEIGVIFEIGRLLLKHNINLK